MTNKTPAIGSPEYHRMIVEGYIEDGDAGALRNAVEWMRGEIDRLEMISGKLIEDKEWLSDVLSGK